MVTNHEKKNRQDSTKNISGFLYELLVFATASLVLKLAWNLGMSSLFPDKFPNIKYIHAVAWLSMLYILVRVAAAGFMAEIERMFSNLVEQLERIVELTQDIIDIPKSRDDDNDDIDDSDLN